MQNEISYLFREKKIEIKETPLPCLSDNDVLVKNIYSSICGTDVASISVWRAYWDTVFLLAKNLDTKQYQKL